MTKDDVLFGYRQQLFAEAARTSVSAACRTFGVHRSTYYAWKRQVDRHGLEMLRPRERRRPQMPNALPKAGSATATQTPERQRYPSGSTTTTRHATTGPSKTGHPSAAFASNRGTTPRRGVARRPYDGATQLRILPTERDRAPLAEGFLDQALDVQRPVAVGCVEQEREVGHGQMTLRWGAVLSRRPYATPDPPCESCLPSQGRAAPGRGSSA
jgi:transposase-like protein